MTFYSLLFYASVLITVNALSLTIVITFHPQIAQGSTRLADISCTEPLCTQIDCNQQRRAAVMLQTFTVISSEPGHQTCSL